MVAGKEEVFLMYYSIDHVPERSRAYPAVRQDNFPPR